MVTIDPNAPLSGVNHSKPAERPVDDKAGTFGDIFRQTVSATKTDSGAESQTVPLSGIRPANFDTQPSPATQVIVDQVEALIDTMAAYQQKLAEEGATLKTLEPLVEKMEDQSQTLRGMISVSEGDSLGSIIEQSLAVSSMEVARFKSGHYND